MATITGSIFDMTLLKRLFKYAHPYIATFRLGLFFTIMLALMAPLRPWLIQYAFDNYIITPNPTHLLNITLLLTGLLVLESVVMFYNTYITNRMGQHVIRDLRVHLFNYVTRFRLKYFDKTAIGTLVTRVVSDIETIAEVFSQGFIVIIGEILQLIVIVAAMFYTDWRLALISLSTIPLLLIATYIFKKAIKSAFQDVRTQVARLNAFVQEHVTGITVLQVFNRQQAEMEKFMLINNEHKKAHIRTVWNFSIFLPVVEVLAAISLGLVVWWGAGEAIEGHVTLGVIMAFILYIYMLFRPIRQLADRFNTLQMGMVSSERVFRLLDSGAHIYADGNHIPKNMKGEIEFQNVWFAYNDEDWVLKDISLRVAPGETIAIVGATGAGKTSIINLISRFYEINKGSIMIDGTDIRKFNLKSLRDNVAVVLQDVFLFSDSILNNITIGNKEITRIQVTEASKAVGVHEFINSLPGGYDYNVRERGTVLSVGQRQLVAFLRAYVYNPKILILDEATSSVDTHTEQLIQKATQKITDGRTSIVIAHRLATVQAANRIIVMDHGRVIESGTHHELLAKEGYYKKLFAMQFDAL